MQVPLQIVFEHIGHSDALEAAVRREAQRLERFYPRITSARVAVLRISAPDGSSARWRSARSGTSRAWPCQTASSLTSCCTCRFAASRSRLAASLAHVVSTFTFGDNPFIPSLGASGAISGVMGGYLVLHPHRRVRVIILRMLTTVPGYVAVGLWFLFQLISAFGVIGQGPQAGGGVAFMAHIGGFIAGVVLVRVFAAGRSLPGRVS